MPMMDQLKKIAGNQRFRIIACVAGCAAALILLCTLIISIMSGGNGVTNDIAVTTYSAAEIEGTEESGVFCKSILSTKVNSEVSDGNTVVIESAREYEQYLNEYDDITVVEPEQVPIVDDWFAAGYYAIVVSSDQYPLPVNLTASAKYVDEEGNVKILVEPTEINEEFVYSQDLESCAQASVVIFLDQELVTDAPSITIMMQDETV